MAINLTVGMGEKLDLGEPVPPEIAACLSRLECATLADLVRHGFIDSQETLRQLLTAAQEATRTALNEGAPFQPIPGTARRFDLMRFGRFIGAVPRVHPGQARRFWKVVRDFQPTTLISRVDLEIPFVEFDYHQIMIHIWHFLDVTVEPQATLVINTHNFNCGHLLIKKTGKIVATGGGLYIKATSIEGQQ